MSGLAIFKQLSVYGRGTNSEFKNSFDKKKRAKHFPLETSLQRKRNVYFGSVTQKPR